jgi:hypothetical protein
VKLTLDFFDYGVLFFDYSGQKTDLLLGYKWVDGHTFLGYFDKLYLLHPRIGKDIDKDKERILFEGETVIYRGDQRIMPLSYPLASWKSLAMIKSPLKPN